MGVVATRDRNVDAVCHERVRDGAPDASRTTGDDRNLTAKGHLHSCHYNSPRMQDVAIVGAGELGGDLAHALARRDIVRSIRLIDAAGSVAAGKALDIMQSAPVEQFSTEVGGATDISYAAGAAVVVIADGAG